MQRRTGMIRLIRGMLTAATVVAIVIGSVVGLDDWADRAATHTASAAAPGGTSVADGER